MLFTRLFPLSTVVLFGHFFGNNFESRVAPEVLSCCPVAASSFDLFLISNSNLLRSSPLLCTPKAVCAAADPSPSK